MTDGTNIMPPETPASPVQSKPAFYRILGDSGRLKTVCLIEIVIPDGGLYFARGTVVCGRSDFANRFSQSNGDGIALQRAQKVLAWFKGVDFNFGVYQKTYGSREYFGTEAHPIRADKMQLLHPGEVDLESSIAKACAKL